MLAAGVTDVVKLDRLHFKFPLSKTCLGSATRMRMVQLSLLMGKASPVPSWEVQFVYLRVLCKLQCSAYLPSLAPNGDCRVVYKWNTRLHDFRA